MKEEEAKKDMKCELCGRRTLEDAVSVVTIKLEELVTEAEIGDALTLIVCYDCIPTLVEWLKNGIKKASTIRRRTEGE
jgi:hypothetical protein